jgi:CheY-like chemotaxis protein
MLDQERTTTPRGRVLIVDDEPLVAQALERLLQPEYAVSVAGSGPDALALLAAGERFDAILCDVIMPEMNGLGFYDAVVRSHFDHAERIVFMTGGMLMESTRKLVRRVGNPVLEKPFGYDAVVAVLQKQIDALGGPSS